MSIERKAHWLRLFLRTWSGVSLVLFPTLFLAFAIKAPVLDHGGIMGWAIWDDVGGHVGPMLFTIYIVWAVFLWRAADDLRGNATLLDFTLWANLAHGALMVFQTTASPHDFAKIFTDVPYILAVPLALGAFREAYSVSATARFSAAD